jgi:F-type H+-transporting ATPase subunit b
MKAMIASARIKKMIAGVVPLLAVTVLYATVVYASGGEEGGHEPVNWKDFIWRSVNFVIFVGFLYWLLGNKVKEFFVERRENIKTTLSAALAAKEEAEKKYKELSEKLDKATGEIADISEMIKAQGIAEKERIIEDAKKAAEKMKEDAQRRVEQEFKKASNQLRAEAVALSIEVAEDILKKKITPEDHESMVRDYLDKVVRKH